MSEHYFAQSNGVWQTNFGSLTIINVDFYEHRYGDDIGSIKVYIVDSDGAIITPSTGAIDGDAIYSVFGDNGNQWTNVTLSCAIPPQSYRVVWYHSGNTSFGADYAVDLIDINSNVYSFESDADGFVTSSGINTTDSSTAFNNSTSVPTSTGATAGQWNRNSGTTSSSSTGPSSGFDGSFYLYTETSSPNSGGADFWLFSPLFS